MNLSSRLSPVARHALITGIAALLLSSLPYLAGYAAQTPQQVFDGAVFDLPDYHTHLGEMQLGLRGEWLHRVLSTSENHAGVLMRTFFIALGHVARIFDLSLPLVYQIARLVFGALFLVAAYRFIAALASRPEVRRVAFTLVAFSSGLGWLMQMLAPAGPDGISPIDFWLIDANSFFSIFIFPHFTAAMALLLEIFRRLIQALELDRAIPPRVPRPLDTFSVALFAFLLATIHPYLMALIVGPAAIFGAAQALRGRPPARAWWMFVTGTLIGAAPVLLYSAIVFGSEPVFRAWAAQNLTPSPPPIYYVLGFGLVLALAFVGLKQFVRENGDRAVFILIWIALVAGLIYLPVGIQRRFIEGIHVPLSLIAAYGLVRLTERLAARTRFVIVNLTLALASLSTMYLVVGYTTAAAMRSEAFFHSGDLIAVVDWLGAHSVWDDTVLAAEPTGSLIPARIGQRVALGHWAETVAYADRQRDIARFYDAATPDADRVELLKQLGVRFVLFGSHERALGAFDPARAPYLQPVYASSAVSVYSPR
ncbi:MAG TPA: hypothetical protein VJG32_20195 [Anaerolineae bacterium]|nr:hypothetical protein [Anaerolineae bacterium]